ncbi:hypothetical protein OG302_40155 [Streptomyces sp. NBC_01283]|uniref:hypothetical protein n=1 Tax=Streptomyces sp. NBC_01283 TaxID=2903812 RepID=UPI00352CCA44|nr:hypothetical protein OG302_40155 [Streptomyces sp. NBC_01283]
MKKELTGDAATAARHERYGRLPERIVFDDMTEEVKAGRSGGDNGSYNPEGSWKYYSCLALDMGL